MYITAGTWLDSRTCHCFQGKDYSGHASDSYRYVNNLIMFPESRYYIDNLYVPCRKLYKIDLYEFQKQVEKGALGDHFYPVSQRVQMNFIFSNNVRILIVFVLQFLKSPQINAKLSKMCRNKSRFYRFWCCHLWNLRLFCYSFLPSLKMDQIAAKCYLGQWQYKTNKCNLTA